MKTISPKYYWINRGLIFFAIIAVISLAFNIYLISKTHRLERINKEEALNEKSCSLEITREKINSRKFIKPLLLADINSESSRFDALKSEINSFIERKKQQGTVRSVSVYLRDLNTSSWADMGDNSEYYPGSLMKVPIMIYYLKQEQDHPGFLKQELQYLRPAGIFPSQTYLGDSIIPGRKYKLEDLIRYMIVESDNNATYVLSSHIDQSIYKQLFTDLNIPYYDPANLQYTISPYQYSKFFRVLYSSTYINKDLSNFALKMLSECNFRSGLVKDLPPGTVVAHKFGERGFTKQDMDFSESGIIYFDSQPYLLTIMTRGSDVKTQTALVRELSAEIYSKYKDI